MSDTLTHRLADLARALERSGAPRASVARLLELASMATVHAVALELVLQERSAPAPERRAGPPAEPVAMRRAA